MEDRQELALEQYAFQVKNQRRARGAVLLETNEGLRLMREYTNITSHFAFENEVKEHLRLQGMERLDWVVPNKAGEWVTVCETGEQYVVYEWYGGEDCDYKSSQGLWEIAANLGHLHQCLKNYSQTPISVGETLLQQYERHNREMKRVYSFMKAKRRKSEFERYAMNCYSKFAGQAARAREKLEKSEYYQIYGKETRDVCHGGYNYHNLIQTKDGLATTNFEHAAMGIQLMDLVYFMRKTMEKNKWNWEKGKAIWEGYIQNVSLCGGEKEFVTTTLSYPIKYWKLLNQYMNGKKTWISDKSLEKMKDVQEQEERKTQFLEKLQSFEKNN